MPLGRAFEPHPRDGLRLILDALNSIEDMLQRPFGRPALAGGLPGMVAMTTLNEPSGPSGSPTGSSGEAGAVPRRRPYRRPQTYNDVPLATDTPEIPTTGTNGQYPASTDEPPDEAAATSVLPAVAEVPGDGLDRDAQSAESWAWVHAAQAGDIEAFGRLYDRYTSVVYRFIYYRLGDRAQAEDLTSETFVRALRRLHSLSNQGRDPVAWFVTIARNLLLDHVKSARYRLEVINDELLQPRTSDAVDSPSAESVVLGSLTNARLLEAVRDLSGEQRECIVLRFLHGLSVAETAEVMGKNDGAIKAMQHRAIRRLHGQLKDELG